PGFMSQVYSLAKDPANDPTLVDDPDRQVDRITSLVRNGGLVECFRSLIVGASPTPLVGPIASYAGGQSIAAPSILTPAIQPVLSYLGKMVREDGLDSAGLGRRLAPENQSVLAAIPGAFSGIVSGGTGFATDATRMRARAVASGRDVADRTADVTASMIG